MANVPLGQAARATRTVSAGIGPISWGYIDIGFLLCMLTCLVLPWHCTIPVFLSFVNRVSQGWVFCETNREADSPRRGGGGREEGWGPLGRPASCSPAASPLPPMGDASVPTPLRTSPAPTDVTICPKKPTVESPCGRRVHLCGRNILVEVEQIGRVVALLERCQPCICRWRVGLTDPLRTLSTKEVHVHAAGVG